MGDIQSKNTRQSTLGKLQVNLLLVKKQIESYKKTIEQLKIDSNSLQTKLQKVESWSMEMETLLKSSEKALLLQSQSLKSALALSSSLEKSIAKLKKSKDALLIVSIVSTLVAAVTTGIAVNAYNKNKLI